MEDGFVVVVVVVGAFATFGMLLLLGCSFNGLIFPLGSSRFSRGGLTAFLSSSGSSKFNERTVDDDRHRSLLEDSCSTGFAVTLAPVLAIVVTVELLVETAVFVLATLTDAEAAVVVVAGADCFRLLMLVADLWFVFFFIPEPLFGDDARPRTVAS